MTFFYESSSAMQIALLVGCQFAVLILASGTVMLFIRKCKMKKVLCMGALFLLCAATYVTLQLDSRLTDTRHPPGLPIPYAVPAAVSVASIALGACLFLSETGSRKTIGNASIKEAFDNLPTGVCFFNESGFPVLCNHAMSRFSFAVCDKDVQFISDIEGCLADGFSPSAGVVRDKSVFVLPDGQAWHLEKRTFPQKSGDVYTQFIAADVTELHRNRVKLQSENDHLRRVQRDLQTLSANVVAATREEELLNTKMRVHDEMGRCLLEARKYLRDGCEETIPDSLVTSWSRAVSMIKYSNEATEEDMLSQIRKTCESVRMSFIQTGSLPKDEAAAYILTCAVRECVTNAVRYAGATELYAVLTEDESTATVSVTNNGSPPEREITEGGGLSTLRRRVERAGGTMKVTSLPSFCLRVTVPLERMLA